MGLRKRAVAFVLNMGANGIGVVRSLGRLRIPVVGVDSTRDAPGLRSRYCKPIVAPDPTKHPEQVLQLLLREGKRGSAKGILYPTSDDFVLFVSRFRKELASNFEYAVSSPTTVERIVNKQEQYELAEQNGIICPRTYYPNSLQDLQKIKDQVEYPAMIKPHYSHLWQERFRLKGIKVSTPDELLRSYTQMSDPSLRAMIQSIVPGSVENIIEVCSYLSPKKGGKILAMFVDRKIRQYPTDFGVGTYMDSVHDAQAVSLCLKLLKRIRYRGVAAVEFKKDPRDGVYKLLDLNARLWLQNMLATQAGINFPLIQYLDLTDQPVELMQDYDDKVEWLDTIQDLRALLRLDGVTRFPISEWLKSIRRVDCHAYFAKDDLRPFLSRYVNLVAELPRYLATSRTGA